MSEPNMSQEEIAKLVSHFKTMKVKPKVDTLQDFQQWMQDRARADGETDDKSQVKVDTVYTTSAMQHFPKISHFSGDGKKDTTYDVWRKEVECIIKEGHPKHAVAQAIRSSLKGEALRVRSRLPAGAEIDEILHKMDSVYGTVEKTEMLLAKFYSARQEPDEGVAAWSCRLEELLYAAIESGQVDGMRMNSMLCTMLWQGLRPHLKDVTGHIVDRVQDFDELRVAIRRFEDDMKQRQPDDKSGSKKPQATSKAAVDTLSSEEGGLKEIRGIVQQLAADMKSLKDNQKQGDKGKGYRQKDHSESQQSSSGSRRFYNQQYRDASRRPQYGDGATGYSNPAQSGEDNDEPVCFRCGRMGHIALGCRAKLDIPRKDLNGQRPSSRGRR